MTGISERTLVEDYKAVSEEVKRLVAELAKAKCSKMKLEDSLIELLDAQEKTATADYEGVGKVISGTPQLYASCLVENEEQLFAYLQGINRGDLVKTKVNAKSLSTLVKGLIENGDLIPEIIRYYLKPVVRLKAAK